MHHSFWLLLHTTKLTAMVWFGLPTWLVESGTYDVSPGGALIGLTALAVVWHASETYHWLANGLFTSAETFSVTADELPETDEKEGDAESADDDWLLDRRKWWATYVDHPCVSHSS